MQESLPALKQRDDDAPVQRYDPLPPGSEQRGCVTDYSEQLQAKAAVIQGCGTLRDLY